MPVRTTTSFAVPTAWRPRWVVALCALVLGTSTLPANGDDPTPSSVRFATSDAGGRAEPASEVVARKPSARRHKKNQREASSPSLRLVPPARTRLKTPPEPATRLRLTIGQSSRSGKKAAMSADGAALRIATSQRGARGDSSAESDTQEHSSPGPQPSGRVSVTLRESAPASYRVEDVTPRRYGPHTFRPRSLSGVADVLARPPAAVLPSLAGVPVPQPEQVRSSVAVASKPTPKRRSVLVQRPKSVAGPAKTEEAPATSAKAKAATLPSEPNTTASKPERQEKGGAVKQVLPVRPAEAKNKSKPSESAMKSPAKLARPQSPQLAIKPAAGPRPAARATSPRPVVAKQPTVAREEEPLRIVLTPRNSEPKLREKNARKEPPAAPTLVLKNPHLPSEVVESPAEQVDREPQVSTDRAAKAPRNSSTKQTSTQKPSIGTGAAGPRSTATPTVSTRTTLPQSSTPPAASQPVRAPHQPQASSTSRPNPSRDSLAGQRTRQNRSVDAVPSVTKPAQGPSAPSLQPRMAESQPRRRSNPPVATESSPPAKSAHVVDTEAKALRPPEPRREAGPTAKAEARTQIVEVPARPRPSRATPAKRPATATSPREHVAAATPRRAKPTRPTVSTPRPAAPELRVVDTNAAPPERSARRQSRPPVTRTPSLVDPRIGRPVTPDLSRPAATYGVASVGKRINERIRYAVDLAERGALYSSRAEFRAVLKVCALSADAREDSTAYSEALRQAFAALQEADDFAPSRDRIATREDLTSLVNTHRTPILKDSETERLSPIYALQSYYAFAEERLIVACGGMSESSQALYGLAKLQVLMATETTLGGPKAIAFYRAAIAIDPENYRAANELGVLLARYGQYYEAVEALSHCLNISPQPETWRSLAKVYRHLGDDDSAAYATERHRLALRARKSGKLQPPKPATEWVDPVVFTGKAPSADPARSLRADAPAEEPAVASRPVATTQAGGTSGPHAKVNRPPAKSRRATAADYERNRSPAALIRSAWGDLSRIFQPHERQ